MNNEKFPEGNGLFKRILVPVDGSRYSRGAVRLASRLARIHHSEIILLHVLDEAVLAEISRFEDKAREAVLDDMQKTARAFLKDMSREVGTDGTKVTLALTRGIPHELILREAKRLDADLIVMGKLGKRGVSRILLGSVAERVIEFAPLPVLLSNVPPES